MERFLRQDGVFLLRLMTIASNALTTVDLTSALWSNYWKCHPPTSDVILSGGADQPTMWARERHQAGETGDDSAVKRKPMRDDEQLEPLASKD